MNGFGVWAVTILLESKVAVNSAAVRLSVFAWEALDPSHVPVACVEILLKYHFSHTMFMRQERISV